ncbi:MAG: hypothetical protein BMS9Abin01_2543 [Gammaproteobacteria bacterium]|nr:MAG: hypothetical protein BMS9Abin01_2543 [Gammaproteobacteria bacterium]
MGTANFFRWDGETLVLEIRLQPRANDDSLVGISDGRLRMRVTAAPVENAANQRMIAILAKEFGVAKSRVRLLAGSRGRDKRVAIKAPRRLPIYGDSLNGDRSIFPLDGIRPKGK